MRLIVFIGLLCGVAWLTSTLVGEIVGRTRDAQQKHEAALSIGLSNVYDERLKDGTRCAILKGPHGEAISCDWSR